MDKGLSAESVLSKVDKITTEVESLELSNKINYFIVILVIKRLKEQGFITDVIGLVYISVHAGVRSIFAYAYSNSK